MTLEGRPSTAWWSQARLLPMLLWTAAGVGLLAGLMSFWLVGRVPARTTGGALASRLDYSWTMLATATGLVMILTASVWLAWQRGLARLLSAQGDIGRTPEMQMIAWVIPVAAWWWPLQDIRRLHRLFEPDDVAGFTELTRRWWAWWLVFWVAQLSAAWIEGSVQGVTGVRAAFIATGVAGALTVPAACYAAVVVRELTGHVVSSLR